MSETRSVIHVLTEGEFGVAFATALGQRFDTDVQGVGRLDPSRWPHSDLQIVASNCELPFEFEVADQLAFALRRPWMPVVLEPRSVRIGPLVQPGLACYACFIRRQRQHGRRTPTDAEMQRTNQLPRMTGFLTAHARLAADLSENLFSTAGSEDKAAFWSPMVRLGLADSRITRGRVVSIDGCERCATRRSHERTAEF